MAFLAITAAIISAAAAYRFFSAVTEDLSSPLALNAFVKSRYREFFEKSKAVDVQGKHVVLFFGLSEVELGINPDRIAAMAKLLNVAAFNIGSRGLPAEIMPVILERAFRSFRRLGAAGITLVMQPPVWALTDRARFMTSARGTKDIVAAVSDAEYLYSLFADSPTSSAELVLRRMAIGDASSSALDVLLHSNWSIPIRGIRPIKVPGLFFDSQIVSSGHWRRETGGKTAWESLAAPTLKSEKSLHHQEDLVIGLDHGIGILHPSISPALLPTLSQLSGVIALHKIRLHLYCYPDRLTVTKRRTPAGELALRQSILQIESYLNAPCNWLGSPANWISGDYLDPIHWSTSGQNKAWRFLASALQGLDFHRK